jgi:hypothetical protein
MEPGSTKGMVDVIDCQFHLKLSLQVLPYFLVGFANHHTLYHT